MKFFFGDTNRTDFESEAEENAKILVRRVKTIFEQGKWVMLKDVGVTRDALNGQLPDVLLQELNLHLLCVIVGVFIVSGAARNPSPFIPRYETRLVVLERSLGSSDIIFWHVSARMAWRHEVEHGDRHLDFTACLSEHANGSNRTMYDCAAILHLQLFNIRKRFCQDQASLHYALKFTALLR